MIIFPLNVMTLKIVRAASKLVWPMLGTGRLDDAESDVSPCGVHLHWINF